MAVGVFKTFITLFSIVSIHLVGTCLTAQTPIWGPLYFERIDGSPTTDTVRFAIPIPAWEYELGVFSLIARDGIALGNGDQIIASSATIWLNDATVVDPSEFNQNVIEFQKPISLLFENELSVRIRSKPGSVLKLAIFGPFASQKVGPIGGTLSLEGIMTATFPAGVFAAETDVSIFPTFGADTREIFDVSTFIYEAGPAAEYDVILNTGNILPDSLIELSVIVPDDILLLPESDWNILIYVRTLQDGGTDTLDVFTAFPTELDRIAKTAVTTIPPGVFTKFQSEDGTYKLSLIVGTAPTFDKANE